MRYLADQLRVSSVYAQCSPEMKLEIINKEAKKSAFSPFVFIGFVSWGRISETITENSLRFCTVDKRSKAGCPR
ncbi:hypothetical protein EM20IM_00960 [Candidatus Methylacidiphilum infernorum]|uniref:Uncharacterized protein n=1 Tax=Candidatus Methylacidiphilum infernorum TaxID=511746 RepID=A0ABX7PVE2_9BACT|nr:hypothetical protein [Candidatus Methylacidiphilum infernorum]QSR86975.1 hypothetical protein EM20IM_00960 [Candidatus Methylacidiphilum infernorum]